jgi:hypothetical protein
MVKVFGNFLNKSEKMEKEKYDKKTVFYLNL